jgi:hypothetical protein
VRFASVSPAFDPLPPMDIAAFVGFAAEGPLHVPVAVESSLEYEAVFGTDPVLALDAQHGRPVRALLGGAVRAFFANGGRRAFAVRVAGNARSNVFPLPGLLRAAGAELVPATLNARSRGSYSDGLSLAATLLARPLSIAPLTAGFSTSPLEVMSDASNELSAGDVLRFTFRAAGVVWMVPAERVTPVVNTTGPARRYRARVETSRSYWFRSGLPTTLPPGPLSVQLFAGGEVAQSVPLEAPPETHGDELALVLRLRFADAPAAGSFVRVVLGAEELWLRVREARVERTGGAAAEQVRLRGRCLRYVRAGLSLAEQTALLGSAPRVERIRTELWARAGSAPATRLPDLGLGSPHPRFLGALPSAEDRHTAHGGEALTPDFVLARARDERYVELWQAAADAAFPLAGEAGMRRGSEPAFFLPLDLAFTPESYLGPVPSALSRDLRDGLEAFGAGLFVDPALADTSLDTLLGEADHRRYQSPAPRALTGIHAALAIEEVSLIAVPDSVHRAWRRPLVEAPAEPAEPAPQSPAAMDGTFRDCRVPRSAPVFVTPVAVDPAGTFTLSWTGPLEPGERYVVEESPRPELTPSTAIYRGHESRLTLWGKAVGTYYYRVYVEHPAGTGPVSATLTVRVSSDAEPELELPASYHDTDLLLVQRALLRMAAARGDLLAVLSLPVHYRAEGAAAHAAKLTRLVGGAEARTLSHGALFHPWLITGRESPQGELDMAPPDGAVSGMLARRALSRGAWVAAANQPLANVLALAPELGSADFQLLADAQVNQVRREPLGFLTLSEDTLSSEPDLVPMHVRRLLILLRRAALKLGSSYVFEPNDAAFRRLVQRSFEALLERLYARGAFAGASESAAFQVVTDAGPATARDAAAGRLSVDLRVAPSAPLAFLTVRLVQSGDQSRVWEVR